MNAMKDLLPASADFLFSVICPTTTGHVDDVTFFRKTLSFLYQSHFGEG